MQASRSRRAALSRLLDAALALACTLAAMLIYFRTLAPGLLWGDSAEFQFAAWLAGFAHPTGYPLYLMLGWLWTHVVPLHDPAWRMNAFSALWGGVASGLTYLLALQVLRTGWLPGRIDRSSRSRPSRWAIGGSAVDGAQPSVLVLRLVALFVALSLIVVPAFWSQATVAEVYTLHAAFVAGTLLALVRWAERQDRRWLHAAAAVYGLSLAHHRTMLLLAPAIAVYLWLVRSRWSAAANEAGDTAPPAHGDLAGPAEPAPRKRRRTTLLIISALLVLPQLLYLYLPLRAARAPYARVALGQSQELILYEPTLRGFLGHVSGQAFSSELGAGPLLAVGMRHAARLLVAELSWPGLLLGLLGLFALANRRPTRRLLVLTGLAFIAIIGFNLLYGIGDIQVFYIPAYLIWMLWMGAGLLALARLLAHLRPARRVAPVLLVVLALAWPSWRAAEGYPRLDRSLDDSARQAWQRILSQPIPVGSVLLSNDRDEMAPQWYLRYVEGVRPDLVGLFPLIQPGPDWAEVAQVGDQALRSGRPVVAIKPMPGLEVKFRLEPLSSGTTAAGVLGSLVRITGPAVDRAPQRSSNMLFGEQMRLTGFDLQPQMVMPGDALAVTLYWQPQRRIDANYTAFVQLVNADGVTVGQSDHLPGGDYYPTGLWRAGELLRDEHRLRLSADLGPAPYELIAGLYTGSVELRHLGAPQRIGYVGAFRVSAAIPSDLQSRLDVAFGEQMALLAYAVAPEQSVLRLQLYWQALQLPHADYYSFVHLVSPEGQIVAQDDSPLEATFPSSGWPPGLTVREEVQLALPGGLARGVYRLVAGLYDPLTLARLPAVGADGAPLGDSILLGQFTLPQ